MCFLYQLNSVDRKWLFQNILQNKEIYYSVFYLRDYHWTEVFHISHRSFWIHLGIWAKIGSLKICMQQQIYSSYNIFTLNDLSEFLLHFFGRKHKSFWSARIPYCIIIQILNYYYSSQFLFGFHSEPAIENNRKIDDLMRLKIIIWFDVSELTDPKAKAHGGWSKKNVLLRIWSAQRTFVTSANQRYYSNI